MTRWSGEGINPQYDTTRDRPGPIGKRPKKHQDPSAWVARVSMVPPSTPEQREGCILAIVRWGQCSGASGAVLREAFEAVLGDDWRSELVAFMKEGGEGGA